MPVWAVPDADLVDGAWLDDGGAATLFPHIVPGTPGSIGAGDDATFIESELAPSTSAVAVNLSDIDDPLASTGHIMRWRRQKDAAGGGQIDLVVQLRQGYVNESTLGTLINSFTDADIPSAWATASDTLSGAEADAITDYTDLQGRMTANQV